MIEAIKKRGDQVCFFKLNGKQKSKYARDSHRESIKEMWKLKELSGNTSINRAEIFHEIAQNFQSGLK